MPRWIYKKPSRQLFVSGTPDGSILPQIQTGAPFRWLRRIISGHYLVSNWVPQQAAGRQMETIPQYVRRRAKRWKLTGSPRPIEFSSASSTHSVDSATKFNTCKMRVDQRDQVIERGILREKLHLLIFCLSISNMRRPAWICVRSVLEPRRPFACSVYHIAHRDRPPAALQCSSILLTTVQLLISFRAFPTY